MATRRIFLKQAVGMAAASAGVSVTVDGGGGGASPRQTAGSPPGVDGASLAAQRGPIGYIRQDIPEFGMPVYKGERYEALIPDTLDLQERAALAVNVLTRATDPEADYEMYFSVDIRRNPPMMDHNFSDICIMKFMEALPLMRLVSGSQDNLEVDRRWRELALRNLGPDGIYYYPLRGRPWALHGPWLGLAGGSEEKAREREQVIVPIMGGRMLSAMMNYARQGNASLWKREAERMVDGLVSVAVDRGSYAVFAPSALYAEKGCTEDVGKSSPSWAAMDAWVALGLVHAYRGTGYEPAITLARKLLNHIVEELHFFGPDGSFGPTASEHGIAPPDTMKGLEAVMDYTGSKYQHFHTHTYVLLAMLEYALATADDKMLKLARRGFEYGRANGNALLGYFPEMLGRPNFETSELCEVADMIALGIKLSAAGAGDYWDDVDRWARNMFAEGQLTPARAALLERYVAGLPVTPVDHNTPVCGGVTPSGYETTDRVIERNIGAFAGWPEPSDWGTAIMHCCTGNSTRSIYYLWDSILNYADGKLRVNLLLNRASPWADVDGHIPYTGQVDVRIKQPVDLAVRLPEWVKPGEARCQVSGQERALSFGGRYARVGAVKPKDVVTLTFPNPARKESVWIEKHPYALYLKGNTVVDIDPPGRTCPLYQRAHYRGNTTRWRKIERFVPEER